MIEITTLLFKKSNLILSGLYIQYNEEREREVYSIYMLNFFRIRIALCREGRGVELVSFSINKKQQQKKQ